MTMNDSLYNNQGGLALNKGIGFSPKTLADWLAVTPGSQRTAQYGYFGPGSLLRKDITGAGDTMIAGDFFTNTFGAKVWDSLNSQTTFFNLLRKVAWGPTTGWRIRSGRNASTQGVGETAVLPAVDNPDLQQVQVQPAFIVTSLGVSALSQFLGSLEGGIGDALAVSMESAEVDHLKKINQQILYPSSMRVINDGGATTFTLPTSGGNYVGVGDEFHSTANAGAGEATGVFTTVDSIAGDVITATATLTGEPDTDSFIYTRSRGGMWSLDDAIAADGRDHGDDIINNGPLYGSLVFGARTAGGWNAQGRINANAGTLRHLATSHLDNTIQVIRQNGFQPDLLLTGVEQEVRLGTILQANQHFIGESKFQVKMGGEATLPGYETGFEVATYKKIALFTDVDVAPVWTLAAGDDGLRGTNMYVLDTRFIEVPVLFTTQYMESRDYIHNNMLGIKAIFLTAANLRVLNFRAQGKITDLSDGISLS